MSTDIAVVTTPAPSSPSYALIPRGLAEALQFSEQLAKSLLVPEVFRGKPADVFLAIAYGLEIGLTPVASLQSIYIVNGVVGMKAAAKVALCLASPACVYFVRVSSSATEATYETLRRGAPDAVRRTVTFADAEQAGWTKNPSRKYQTDPQRMLEARAKGWLADDTYPEVLRGMATAEELYDEAGPRFSAPPPPSTTNVIDAISAPPSATAGVGTNPPPQSALDLPTNGSDDLAVAARLMHRTIVEASTSDALGALVEELSALTKQLGRDHALTKELRAAYRSKKEQLSKAGAA